MYSRYRTQKENLQEILIIVALGKRFTSEEFFLHTALPSNL